jgi:hypothetical protein
VSATRATVFGLDVRVDRELSFLSSATVRPTGRTFDISLHAGDAADLDWPDSAELISDQREPDGTVNFRIEADSEAGYLIWGPTYGANLLAGDGRHLRSTVGTDGFDAWQRLLVAQVLPFAAVLRELEVLHASAVVIDGGAVAFLGRSGSGKTSLALGLCERGATFLADDVLALERVDDQLLGHPGTPVAGIDHAEAERLAGAGGLGQEVLAVNAREHVVRVPQTAEQAPVQALFFIDRRADGPAQPRFEPAADAQMLLSATFNLVLATPQRLQGLLDACALAARGRVERIVIGPGVDATELGAAVERRLGV